MSFHRNLRTLTIVLLLLLAGMVTERSINWIAGSLGLPSVLAGDPTVYESRWHEIASGNIPYFDTVFEHLPLNIVPIGVAAALSGFGLNYTAAWAIVASSMVAGSVWVVRSIANELDDQAITVRYLILLAPLLPLVLFRNDILALLLAAIAYLAVARGRDRTAYLSMVTGILAKGWPAVLTVADWWSGRRIRPLVISGFTLALGAALMLTPGFRQGRSFSGVHQETVSGSLILGWRHLTGVELGVFNEANAVYVDAGPWAILLNLSIGVGMAAIALLAMRRQYEAKTAATLLAALTLCAILASPLLSAQFLLWPTVFLAVDVAKPIIAAFVFAACATIVLLGVWDHQATWWTTVLVARNLALVGVTGAVSYSVARGGNQRLTRRLAA